MTDIRKFEIPAGTIRRVEYAILEASVDVDVEISRRPTEACPADDIAGNHQYTEALARAAVWMTIECLRQAGLITVVEPEESSKEAETRG